MPQNVGKKGVAQQDDRDFPIKDISLEKIERRRQEIHAVIEKKLNLPQGYHVKDISYQDRMPVFKTTEDEIVAIKGHAIEVETPDKTTVQYIVGEDLNKAGNLPIIAEINEHNEVIVKDEPEEQRELRPALYLATDEDGKIEEMPQKEQDSIEIVKLIEKEAKENNNDVAGVMKLSDRDTASKALNITLPRDADVYAVDYKNGPSRIVAIRDGKPVDIPLGSRESELINEMFEEYKGVGSKESITIKAGDQAVGISKENGDYDVVQNTAINKYGNEGEALYRDGNNVYDISLDINGEKVKVDPIYPAKELHIAGETHQVEAQDLSAEHAILAEIAERVKQIESLNQEIRSLEEITPEDMQTYHSEFEALESEIQVLESRLEVVKPPRYEIREETVITDEMERTMYTN